MKLSHPFKPEYWHWQIFSHKAEQQVLFPSYSSQCLTIPHILFLYSSQLGKHDSFRKFFLHLFKSKHDEV